MTTRILSKEDQLEAQAKLRDFCERADAPQNLVMGKAAIATLGQRVFMHTYGATDSDEDAHRAWSRHVNDLEFSNPTAHFVLTQQSKLPDGIILTFGSARWVKDGCPVYRPGHKQAAALMATRISADVAEHVKPPHRAFFIDLPDGLLEISGLEGAMHPAIGIFVYITTITDSDDDRLPPGDYWSWICMAKSSFMIWQATRSLEQMIDGSVLAEEEYFGLGYEMGEHDQRLRRLVISLIVSLCLDLASGKALKRKVEPLVRAGKKAAKDGPSCTVLLDTEPVEIDARPFVQAYLAGERNSPAFQHVVGMHWKNQAYGPGHSLRRPIKIMPYKRYEHLPRKSQEQP